MQNHLRLSHWSGIAWCGKIVTPNRNFLVVWNEARRIQNKKHYFITLSLDRRFFRCKNESKTGTRWQAISKWFERKFHIMGKNDHQMLFMRTPLLKPYSPPCCYSANMSDSENILSGDMSKWAFPDKNTSWPLYRRYSSSLMLHPTFLRHYLRAFWPRRF